MKKKLLLASCLLGGLAMVLPACSSAPEIEEEEKEFLDDPVTYGSEEEKTIRLSQMTRGEEKEFTPPSKVTLHYHNDDNKCLDRRFYTWVTGVDGLERKPNGVWTATDMEIELDFSVLTDYKDSISLFFIIKMAGTWAGQSEDTELKYELFADYITSDKLEVWTVPGEGTSIEIYGNEEDSLKPKVTTAKFNSWKNIHCTCTIDKEDKEKGKQEVKWGPTNYKLYAFDKEYLNSPESIQKSRKEFYLLKERTLSGTSADNEFDIPFNYTAKINVQYVLESWFPGYTQAQKIIVGFENLYKTERFEAYYTYSGSDLGVTYTPTATTFKLWSPISASVNLNIYENPTPKALSADKGSDVKDGILSGPMSYSKGGVWELTVLGDLKNMAYTYTVTNSGGSQEAVDPYAKACGVNGLRGFIYDSADTNPEGWDDVPAIWDGKAGYDIATPQSLSIYEIHIRDLTMDESWVSNKGNAHGSYKAFYESGTRLKDNPDVTTGFDHIEELGVNAIQILPVFDNDNDERPDKLKFNWGYNPLNYNCVEGAYSSDPYNPLVRIKEYKELIQAYANNKNHTRTIMDVVYNHVSSASASCFTKVMPKYYFRYDKDWNYMDGSGCNNEVQTDATMMRKYIVDSLLWWASEYKIKGFRFDLMGLIDSWTMREVKDKLYAYDKDIYVYGEGWTSGGYHGKYEKDGDTLINGGSETDLVYSQLYPSQTSPGILGGFNNGGRDNLKGSNDNGYKGSPYPQWGFISKGADIGDGSERVGDMLRGINPYGIRGSNPLQTVNYASCHDNYTLWDQLRYTLAPNGYVCIYNPDTDKNDIPVVPNGTQEPNTQDLVYATLTCHGAIFASNGAAFIQGGEELYRSKTYEKAEDLAKYYDGTVNEENVVRPFSDGSDYKHYVDPEKDKGKGYVQATSEVWMYGKVTSHNSYKSDDCINSFKWDRKVKVGSFDTSKYINVWSTMIKTHAETAKYSYPENLDTPKFNIWGAGNGSHALALWNGATDGSSGFRFVISGRDATSLGYGDSINGTVVYASRDDWSFSEGNINLKPFTFICVRVG